MKTNESVASPTHLVVGRSNSYGDLFRVLSELSEDKFEVLELFPVGQGGHLILEILVPELQSAQKGFSELVDRLKSKNVSLPELVFFPNIDDSIVDAYLSLNTPSEFTGSIVVLEDESLAKVFGSAVKAVAKGGSIFDLRFLKGSQPKAFCLITGLTQKIDTDITQTLVEFNQVTKNFLQSVRRLHKI